MPINPAPANAIRDSKVLVLGGARSGKSRLAERIVCAHSVTPVYIATAQAHDEEMAARIARHRADRDTSGWRTVEAPLDLADAIARESRDGGAVLADCLTLWLSNVMLSGRDVEVEAERLAAAAVSAAGTLVLVSNEVGLGIVPDNPLARAFRDHAGRLHQRLAALLPTVLFVAAGLPLALKGTLPEMAND